MMIKVSIVIVCMNNLKNLYPCLNSIKKYTSIEYETFVVAYLFSKENLSKLKIDFPWVKIIESNEYRGFSENNNLALRQAKGKYCFVLNDDTELINPLIEGLVNTIETLPDKVAIVSPPTYYPDGSIQSCGRPPINTIHFLLTTFKMWDEQKVKSKYTYREGVFKSYNIVGAAFLIKREVFEEVGWFDEKYFFTPEDIALSTKLNKMGYSCYVNSDLWLYHYEGQSRKVSMSYAAILPTMLRGNLIFFSHGNKLLYAVLVSFYLIWIFVAMPYQYIRSLMAPRPNFNYALFKGYQNCLATCFTTKSTKEIFIKYYTGLQKK